MLDGLLQAQPGGGIGENAHGLHEAAQADVARVAQGGDEPVLGEDAGDGGHVERVGGVLVQEQAVADGLAEEGFDAPEIVGADLAHDPRRQPVEGGDEAGVLETTFPSGK